MPRKDYDLSDISVLVVDENKYMQILLKEILRAFSIRSIESADDGADALKVLKSFRADLIITDAVMSPIDGIELTSFVRRDVDSRFPYVPIIVLTGHTEYERVMLARDAGANEFMAKPVSPKALYSRIASIIDCKRPFIRAGASYVGPCRRRNCSMNDGYIGPERRKTLQTVTCSAPIPQPVETEMTNLTL